VAEQPYKRPPITEAIIEIRFATAIDADAIAKTGAAYRQLYPSEQIAKNVNVAVDVAGRENDPPRAQINEETGHRRSSADLTELILIWPFTFVVSQLAPYPGWREFFARFVRDWTLWKKAVGYRKIGRVGVRYINRIDIPVVAGSPTMEEAEFLNVYPHLPEALGVTFGYGVQALLAIQDIGCKLVLNSSVVPSPLLNHTSFMLDQDIAKEVDLPQRDEQLYELLEEIRVKKNSVFESCITDRARELFQQ
jgi:uncharacterized protein (TIGR04255 family)